MEQESNKVWHMTLTGRSEKKNLRHSRFIISALHMGTDKLIQCDRISEPTIDKRLNKHFHGRNFTLTCGL